MKTSRLCAERIDEVGVDQRIDTHIVCRKHTAGSVGLGPTGARHRTRPRGERVERRERGSTWDSLVSHRLTMIEEPARLIRPRGGSTAKAAVTRSSAEPRDLCRPKP